MKQIKPPRHSPHHHSFKVRPHAETSYALLAFLALLGIVVLGGFTANSLADMTDPVSGQIVVKAAILTQPPTFGATISQPSNGQVFTDSDITVSGSCDAGKLVKVTKNTILAGTTQCNIGGHYSLTITLFSGQDILAANSYDAADQSGPDNPTVTVTYNAPLAGPPSGGTIAPITLQTPGNLGSVYVGQPVTFPLTITGGVAPYAVYITWGDGTDNVYSKAAAGNIDFGHTYDKPGPNSDTYPILITVTDAAGNRTTLPLTVGVHAQITAVTSGTIDGGHLAVAWPVMAAAALMIISFWIGELITSGYFKRRFNVFFQR